MPTTANPATNATETATAGLSDIRPRPEPQPANRAQRRAFAARHRAVVRRVTKKLRTKPWREPGFDGWSSLAGFELDTARRRDWAEMPEANRAACNAEHVRRNQLFHDRKAREAEEARLKAEATK